MSGPVAVLELAAAAFGAVPALAGAVCRLYGTFRWFYLAWAAYAALGAAGTLAVQDWAGAAAFAASALLAVALYWRSRRKKRRSALKVIGDESRRILAGLVERMRDLAPVPEGARA